jgi:hypothetical protein
MASGNSIWLDEDAADWGWFVDPTPGDDSEFFRPGDQGEQDRMDFLTAVIHEMGHLLGRGHEQEEVMSETLAPGTRPAIEPISEAAWLLAAEDILAEIQFFRSGKDRRT